MILSEPLSEKMRSKIRTIFSLVFGSHTVYSGGNLTGAYHGNYTHVKHNKQKQRFILIVCLSKYAYSEIFHTSIWPQTILSITNIPRYTTQVYQRSYCGHHTVGR